MQNGKQVNGLGCALVNYTLYVLLLWRVNHFSLIWIFYNAYMGFKFCEDFYFQSLTTKNAEFKSNNKG